MAAVPSTMKAIVVSAHGGPEVLQYTDVPVPRPSAGQVLVRNEFSGVNYIDTYFRTGLYQAQLPLIPGREAAGHVVAVEGGSTLVSHGQRVVYMQDGTYAQYTAVDVEKLVPIPNPIATQQAAAVYLQGLTAWTFVRQAADVKPGQWVLVHAAAGGVGLLLLQLLRGSNAKTIATASTPQKCQLARSNGADWTINSHDPDMVAKVKEITEGHGIDVIFDGVGAATFDADLEMIAMRGLLVSFGNASGPVPPVNLLRLGPKNVKLMRPVVNGYIAERKALEKFASELFELVMLGVVKVVLHKTYPLSEAARAHVDIESRQTSGKLLINCD
ncbi:Alcohol dehydrogenase superfamily, zinc-type [Moelleriella libera RCEF 2490]|uniref:Probable quinone oxidoreductase n=1 Tax=Moelleriella libera RCEF 2490 TaxID=1081109 RepID=A0A166P9P7_9HYPO|nr:Alcohol dehydrogenase superfamily, zinc-type [Moelleriella libera RCEF 2490]